MVKPLIAALTGHVTLPPEWLRRNLVVSGINLLPLKDRPFRIGTVLLEGTADLCGGPLDTRVIKGLDTLVRDQIMPMKTTFTPGHYRRRVAAVLARRLLTRLYES